MRRLSWLCAAALSGCVAGEITEGTDLPDPTGGGGGGGAGSQNPALACEGAPRDPGRVTLHRLNRAEYDNTVRDLVGTTQRPARGFPSDDHGYGFDNIADVLSMSSLLADKYALAAEQLVGEILASPFEGPTTRRAEAEVLGATAGAASGQFWNVWSNGEVAYGFTVELEGEYALRTRVFGTQAGDEPVRMELAVDTTSLGTVDVPETRGAPAVVERRATLAPGAHTFRVRFLNDFHQPPEDRNLFVDWLESEGPYGYTPPPANPEAFARIVTCDPEESGLEACTREVLGDFAARAWRRPVTDEEIDRLFALADVAYAEGDGFTTGLSLGMQAILLSPHFLFRVELDPDPASLDPHPLSEHELAARLSYFLWSSAPDAALRAKADAGELSDPEVLAAEARRMLADDKSAALVDNFAGQWLYTRNVESIFPDPAVYPDFDEALRASMAAETNALFASFLNDERPMIDLLDADYTFLDDRLAAHYGLPAPGSDEVVRTALPAGERAGVLSHASLLSVTSRPKRTSPVVRGAWILEHLLCQPPPPPPPEVEGFPEDVTAGTVRERLAQHRSNPSCATCHDLIDPLGLALEAYDGIGRHRTMDQGEPVDTTGTLPDGTPIDGLRDLARVLKADPNTPECFTEQAFVYALGRGRERHDVCNLHDIGRDFVAQGGSFEDLVVALVTHPAFTHRRGEPEAE